MKRLAIVSTHPIQYNAPWFRLLEERKQIKPKVFYTWSQTEKGIKYDPGFNMELEWDIPLLEGYEYQFVKNISSHPGSRKFRGIINPELNKEIEKWKPDAILVFSWCFESHLKCMYHFSNRVPVYFRGDSTLLNETKGLKKLLRTVFLKWVYSHVDKALYVGTNSKNYFLRHGLKEDQLCHVPHAVDNMRFSKNEAEYATAALKWRKALNIPVNDLVFLFAGKLEVRKDAELLLDAFSEVKLANVHLVIVGNGIEEKKLKATYSAVQNVVFMDFQNQSKMPIVYHLSDVFVYPSKNETWGLAINEAMACKRAILSSDKCGGAVDLVRNEINGYIFQSGNKLDLKEKMQKIIDNRQKIVDMGRSSFEIVQEYSFTNVCDAIEEILRIDAGLK